MTAAHKSVGFGFTRVGPRAILIPTDGELQEVELPLDDNAQLDALQGYVGGNLEAVVVPLKGVTAFVNEEGKYAAGGRPLPENAVATALTSSLLMPGDWIAGPMVLVGYEPGTPDIVPLPRSVTPRKIVATLHAALDAMAPRRGGQQA